MSDRLFVMPHHLMAFAPEKEVPTGMVEVVRANETLHWVSVVDALPEMDVPVLLGWDGSTEDKGGHSAGTDDGYACRQPYDNSRGWEWHTADYGNVYDYIHDEYGKAIDSPTHPSQPTHWMLAPAPPERK